jgi:hypothetical protein
VTERGGFKTGIDRRNVDRSGQGLADLLVCCDPEPRRERFCFLGVIREALTGFRMRVDKSGGPLTEPTRSRTKSRPETGPPRASGSGRRWRRSSRLPSQATFPRYLATPPRVPCVWRSARCLSMISAASCSGSTRRVAYRLTSFASSSRRARVPERIGMRRLAVQPGSVARPPPVGAWNRRRTSAASSIAPK